MQNAACALPINIFRVKNLLNFAATVSQSVIVSPGWIIKSYYITLSSKSPGRIQGSQIFLYVWSSATHKSGCKQSKSKSALLFTVLSEARCSRKVFSMFNKLKFSWMYQLQLLPEITKISITQWGWICCIWELVWLSAQWNILFQSVRCYCNFSLYIPLCDFCNLTGKTLPEWNENTFLFVYFWTSIQLLLLRFVLGSKDVSWNCPTCFAVF